MLGIVFTSLIDMLEEKVSPDFADDVIVAADLDNEGAFTSVGYYPFSDMQKLLGVLVEKTGKPADVLLHDFGYYLFGKLAAHHGSVMGTTPNIIELLYHLDDDIHMQVKRLYPDADLPTFNVLGKTANEITVEYISHRELVSLAEGLIDSAADFFENSIIRETTKTSKDCTYEFTVKMTQAPL
tara:strand:- start:73 stop:621 length:549 start_codon:yes stop_codon:yes gene_type:complete